MKKEPLQLRINTAESALHRPGQLVTTWFNELRQAFPLGLALARRNFQARYRQTALGYFWAVLPVLAATLIFVLMQRVNLLNTGKTPIPYPVYAFLGAMFWQLFATSVMGALDMAQSSRGILGKLYFPRDALLIAAGCLTLIDLGIKLALVPIVLIAFGVYPDGGIVMLPVVILITALLGFSIGLLLLPFNLVYQDTRMVLQLLLSALVFVTPVGYVARDHGLFGLVVSLNPLSALVEAGRNSLSAVPIANFAALGIVGGLAVALTLIGLLLYHLALPIVVERQSA